MLDTDGGESEGEGERGDGAFEAEEERWATVDDVVTAKVLPVSRDVQAPYFPLDVVKDSDVPEPFCDDER